MASITGAIPSVGCTRSFIRYHPQNACSARHLSLRKRLHPQESVKFKGGRFRLSESVEANPGGCRPPLQQLNCYDLSSAVIRHVMVLRALSVSLRTYRSE